MKKGRFLDSALDFELSIIEKNEVQNYKKDAIYIVDWVKSGKNLMVYIHLNFLLWTIIHQMAQVIL